ncbi:MAG: hypothetical protein ABSF23_06820 [Terracidiphilus sp.]
MRSFAGARQGFQVGQHWYCGVECLVQAARGSIAQLLNRRVVEIPRTPRLSLGLVLLSKGYVTAEQLRLAASQNRRRNESLDTTLVRMRLATDKQLAQARSAQWGYPVLAQEHIGHMVQADIPQSILDAYSAVPFHYSLAAKRIFLGFVFRVEHSLLEAIEQITGCRVEPCFVTAADLMEQAERVTCAPDYCEVLIDDPGTPEKMALAVGRIAAETVAREACFTQCRNYVWARLIGKGGIMDVVFQMKNAASEAIFTEADLRDEPAVSLV